MRYTLAALIALALLPSFALAQTTGSQADLQAQIRTAITTDPRSASMSQAQLDALVNALAGKASQQGMTAQDIVWRPYDPSAVTTQAPAGTANSGSELFYILIALFGLMATTFVAILMHHHRLAQPGSTAAGTLYS